MRCWEVGSGKASDLLADDVIVSHRSPIRRRSDFATFAAVFQEPVEITEMEFERRLWRTLQQLNDIDTSRFRWDDSVAYEILPPSGSASPEDATLNAKVHRDTNQVRAEPRWQEQRRHFPRQVV